MSTKESRRAEEACQCGDDDDLYPAGESTSRALELPTRMMRLGRRARREKVVGASSLVLWSTLAAVRRLLREGAGEAVKHPDWQGGKSSSTSYRDWYGIIYS